METSTTLLNTKSAFLRQQVRLLSQPLAPSASWSTFAPPTTSGPLPPKQISTALTRVNDKLAAHNKNVYSAPSQRHVAEQLDALYWNQVLEEDGEADAQSLAVSRDADLTRTEVVDGLPMDLRELQIYPNQALSGEDAKRYATLRKRLVEAARRRDAQRRRAEGYRGLKKLVEPLESARENVQPNLVTKDGELSRELDRMRVLCARVAAGVGDLQVHRQGKSLNEGISQRERLRAAMDLT
jgi:hypothetical protein